MTTLTADLSITPPARPAGARGAAVLTVAAAVAAPILFAVGQALLPVLPEDLAGAFAGMAEHRDQMLASRLVTAAGAFLFVPALVAVLSLVRAGARGARLLVAGGVIMGVGTFCNGLSEVTLGYATHAATAAGVARDAGRSVVGALDHLGPVALPVSFLPVVVFGLGTLVVAVALLVARTVPVWQPVLILVGVLLAFATAGMGPIVLLTQMPLIVAFAALGLGARRHLLR